MSKINSLEELKVLRDRVKEKIEIREKGENIEDMIVIKVGMDTCGIAAGAKEVMRFMTELVRVKNIQNAVVIQRGCVGYCDQEPIVEVAFPTGRESIYKNVDQELAQQIIEKYIKSGEMVDRNTYQNTNF